MTSERRQEAPRNALVECHDCGAWTTANGFEVHVRLGIVKGVRCARCVGSDDGRVEILT